MAARTRKREDLDQECKQVAHDARFVHEWLKPILAQSAAAKGGFSFKDRLKPWHEIKQKVLAKRSDPDPKKRKPGYRPSQITDASGMRIVSLFNSEIPEVLDKLLALFTLPPSDASGRFKDPCVKEIIFYSSRRGGDPLSIKPAVERVVEAHDLKRVYKVPKDDSSSYSSVHVIIEAECGADGNRVSAHCEIQLRSVFEEAWSEINHRLVYAPTKRGKALDPDAMQTAFAAGPAEWQHHLDALKSLTDGCAQYADLIRRPFLEQLAEPRERPPQSSEKFAEIAPAFRGCGEQVRKAVDKAFKLRDSADSRPPGKDGKGDQFAEAAKAFADALDALEADQACSERVELRHLLLEERAYCLLYSGNAELKGQAEQIFLDLVTTGTGSYKTYLRYAQIKRDAGEFDEARTLLMEALQRARTTPGSENSMFVITRNLGYVCWKISNLATALDDRKALLSEAISHTREALTFASPTRRANGLNNLLYYLWELADLTDESEELAEQIRRTLTEFKAALVPEKATLRELDTLMRVEHCYGDKTEAGAIAHKLSSRLRKKMDAQGSAPSPRTTGRLERLKSLTPDEQDMYLYAQEVLTEETSVG